MTEVIRLNQVSLWRRTQEEFSYDLKKTVLSFLEGKYRKPARKLVLDRVDLKVEPGEKVGIIGANGSGKSTLLKVISGILKPTTGQVRVRGQIAPLIELGAGFDPDISVMDNIILYGVLLGFSREEMKQRATSILDFAELEEYARIPVKALSSGMVARLGFAIATDIQPDILILDEVLSVGDESFKNKCKQRMEKFWDANATILIVSHDLQFVRKSCQRVIWLDQGHIRFLGDPDEALQCYLSTVTNAPESKVTSVAIQGHVLEEQGIEAVVTEELPPVEAIDSLENQNIISQELPSRELAVEEVTHSLDSQEVISTELPLSEIPVEEATVILEHTAVIVEELPLVEIPKGEAIIPPPEKIKEVVITRIFILNEKRELTSTVAFGKPFYIGLEYIVKSPIERLRLGLHVNNQQRVRILEPVTNNCLPETGAICQPGKRYAYVRIPGPLLVPGQYYIAGIGACQIGFGHHHLLLEDLLTFDVVVTDEGKDQWFGLEAVHPPLEWTIE